VNAVIEGRARVLDHDVNTDYLISSRRKKETLDPVALSRYLLEDVDPAFAASVRPGDILVAGNNFGCGSAMEVGVTVVLGAGIQTVVATSFARTYWRNAVNNGLRLIEADTHGITEGQPLRVTLAGDRTELWVGSPAHQLPCAPTPVFVQTMLDAGGLVAYLRSHRRLA
jgi:3-isopropylmalate/(R)-2-methylmalate dehydratase small subunit